MYVLHWERMSGAIAPQALMEEMGVAYRKIPVDMAAQAHKSAAYRSVCPTMRVPALETPQGEVLGESGAIVLLLGERNPESEMVPAPGDPDRARFLFWLFYMASVGYPTFSRAWHPEQFTLESAAEASIKAVAESDLARIFGILDGAVHGAPYFLERGFSALDIYLTMLSRWSPDRPALFVANPRLAELCQAVEHRKASGAVFQEHFG